MSSSTASLMETEMRRYYEDESREKFRILACLDFQSRDRQQSDPCLAEQMSQSGAETTLSQPSAEICQSNEEDSDMVKSDAVGLQLPHHISQLFIEQSSQRTHQPSERKYSPVYQVGSKELKEQGRSVARYVRELMQRRNKWNTEITEDEKVISEKPEEIVHPSDAGPFQHVDREYATPNPEDVGHLSEIPSQQEQAEMQGLPCSNNNVVEYCMSDEYIDHLEKIANAYFSRVKKISRKEIIANGLQCLTEEAFFAFRNYLAEKDAFEGIDYEFGELLHHCFSIDENRNYYCHYNFTVEMKDKDEECWTSRLYFAETKVIHGVKYYFCSPLEATSDGHCNSCKNQGVNELKHPSDGGYEKDQNGTGCQYFYDDSSDDKCM